MSQSYLMCAYPSVMDPNFVLLIVGSFTLLVAAAFLLPYLLLRSVVRDHYRAVTVNRAQEAAPAPVVTTPAAAPVAAAESTEPAPENK